MTVRVTKKLADHFVRLAVMVAGPTGLIAEGDLVVTAPKAQLYYDDLSVPGLVVQSHRHFDALIARAEVMPALPVIVICPESADAVFGAVQARDHGLIMPLFVGAPDKIAAAAAETLSISATHTGGIGADISGVEIVAVPDHRAAALRAVAMIHEGRGRALMKGHLHTDQILHAILKKDGGLRTNRRLSHVFVMDVPGLDHPLFVMRRSTSPPIWATRSRSCKMPSIWRGRLGWTGPRSVSCRPSRR